MTDTNRVRVGLIVEGTDAASFGVTPANPAFATLRATRIDLVARPKTVISEEIRDDRQVADLILVGTETGGAIAGELSVGAWDPLIEAALFGTWSERPGRLNATADSSITEVVAGSQTIAMAAGPVFVAGHLVRATGFGQSANNGLFLAATGSGGTQFAAAAGSGLVDEAAPPAGARLRVVGIQGAAGDVDAAVGPARLVSTVLDFTQFGLLRGDWIKIGGATLTHRFAVAGCNGWARIGAVAATALTLDIVPSGFAASAETTSTIRLWIGDRLTGGVTRRSFTAEVSYLGQAAPTHIYHRGLMPAAFRLELASEQTVKTEVRFIGAASEDRADRLAGATSVPASTGGVLTATANVGRLGSGGGPVAGPNYVTATQIEIDKGLRAQGAVGTLGAVGIGVGRARVTGRLSTYFGSRDLLRKLLANEATSWDLALTDADGRTLLIDLPRIKFSSGAPDVPGPDRDVMLDLEFQAIRHPDLGFQIQIHRFHEGT